MSATSFPTWKAATDPPLAARQPGYVYLHSGRVVYWTGRIAIGLRYQTPLQRVVSRDAQHLQDLFAAKPRERSVL